MSRAEITRIVVDFETINAAFEDNARAVAAAVLRAVALKLELGMDGGKVFDANGNSVGTWEVWS